MDNVVADAVITSILNTKFDTQVERRGYEGAREHNETVAYPCCATFCDGIAAIASSLFVLIFFFVFGCC